MMTRLTEYSDSCVRMPDRMPGMPMAVWNRPVTKPASMPAITAHSSATHMFTPAIISMMHTAPPVAMVPSTVRSEKFSTL